MKIYWRLIRLANWQTMIAGAFLLMMFTGALRWLFDLLFEYLHRPTIAAYVFTGLFVVFGVATLGNFFRQDLLAVLEDADDRLRDLKRPASQFHHTLLEAIAINLVLGLAVSLLGAYCFLLSCHAWAAAKPDIFASSASGHKIDYFVLDLALKGALFDVMEHFDYNVSRIQLKPGQFIIYSFFFRLYISIVVVGTAVKAMGLFKLAFLFPENKPLLAKLARNLGESA